MKTLIYICLILTLNVFNMSSNNHSNPKKHIYSLDLINFYAIKNGDKVNIYWDMKSASNYSSFTLERSKNGVDFEKVSLIDAANINNELLNYIETDYTPIQGISYYRLKLTTKNNDNNYSQIIMVNCIYNKSKISVYPNPSDGELKISIQKMENNEILVVLRDLDGKEYFSKVLVVYENSEIIGIDNEHKLSPGTYIITATSNNILYSQKLIIKQ